MKPIPVTGLKKIILEKIVLKKLKQNRNKVAIDLCINDMTELYGRFSVLRNMDGSQSTGGSINNDIVEYLKNKAGSVPFKDGIVVVLKTGESAGRDKNKIEKMIKESVLEQSAGINSAIKRTNRNTYIFALIGMLLIGFTQIFPILKNRYSLNEFVIVMSWVFMWKAVELFVFNKADLVKQKRVLAKIFFADFVEPGIHGSLKNHTEETILPK